MSSPNYGSQEVNKILLLIKRYKTGPAFTFRDGIVDEIVYAIQHTHDLGISTCKALSKLLEAELYAQCMQVTRPYFETCALLLWAACGTPSSWEKRIHRVATGLLCKRRQVYQRLVEFHEDHPEQKTPDLSIVKRNIQYITEWIEKLGPKQAPGDLFGILRDIEKWELANYEEAIRAKHSRKIRYAYVVQSLHMYAHGTFNYFRDGDYSPADDRAISAMADAFAMYATAVEIYSGKDPYGNHLQEVLNIFGKPLS
jgi:hypothetical protein